MRIEEKKKAGRNFELHPARFLETNLNYFAFFLTTLATAAAGFAPDLPGVAAGLAGVAAGLIGVAAGLVVAGGVVEVVVVVTGATGSASLIGVTGVTGFINGLATAVVIQESTPSFFAKRRLYAFSTLVFILSL